MSQDYILEFECDKENIEFIKNGEVEIYFTDIDHEINHWVEFELSEDGKAQIDIRKKLEDEIKQIKKEGIGLSDETIKCRMKFYTATEGYRESQWSLPSNKVSIDDVEAAISLYAPKNLTLSQDYILEFECNIEDRDYIKNGEVEITFLELDYDFRHWVEFELSEDGKAQIDIRKKIEDEIKHLIREGNEISDESVKCRMKFYAGTEGYRESVWSLPSNKISVISYIQVASLTIAPSNPIVCLDHSYYLGKTISPVDAYYEKIEWTSDNPEIVAVDENGKITGKAVGTADITAKIGTVTDTVTVSVYEITSNVEDEEENDDITEEAGEIIDDIVNNDDPDIDDTDIDPEDLDEIKEDIQEGIENGDTFHVDVEYIQKFFDSYKKNWGQIQKAAKDLNAHFEGAYSVEVEMYHKDKDDEEHHIGNITELDDGATFSFDLPSGQSKKYIVVRIHKNKNGEEVYTPVEYTISANGKLTALSDKAADFIILSVDETHEHSFTYTASGATITAKCTDGCDITDGLTMTLSAPKNLTYDGKAKKATINSDYNKTAFSGKYSIKYYKGSTKLSGAPVDAGTYTAKITVGEATATKKFTIKKINNPTVIDTSDITVEKGGKTFDLKTRMTGLVGEPTYEIIGTISGSKISTKGVLTSGSATGVITVKINIPETTNYFAKAASIKVRIKSQGSEYTEEIGDINVKFTNLSLDTNNVAHATYTGSAITPEIKVTSGKKTLVAGTDYKVTYSNNIAASANTKSKKATIVITGIGNFEGEKKVDFVIDKKKISDKDITVSNTVVQSGKKVAPTVTFGGIVLVSGTDYTGVPTKAMTKDGYSFKIKGKGNFSGERKITVFVKKKSELKSFAVSLDSKKATFTYNGEAKKLTVAKADGSVKNPQLTVKDKTSNKVLTEGKDFALSYTDNVNAGTVNVTVTGLGAYKGSVTKSYQIGTASKATFTVTNKDALTKGVTYNKNGVTPKINITANIDSKHKKVALVEGKDYKVTYSNNKNAGKGKAKVTFMGNYKGAASFTQSFKINKATYSNGDITVSAKDFVYNTKNPKASSYFAKAGTTLFVTLNGKQLTAEEFGVTYYQGKTKLTNSTKLDFGKSNVITITAVVVPKSTKNYTIASGTKVVENYKVINNSSTKYTDVSKAAVTVVDKNKKNVATVRYTGKAIEFNPNDKNSQGIIKMVIGSGKNQVVLYGSDIYKYFDVTYTSNVKVGEARIILNPKDMAGQKYTGSASGTFTICATSLK